MRSSGCPEVRIMGRSGQRSFTSHDRSTPSMTPGSRMSAKIMATSRPPISMTLEQRRREAAEFGVVLNDQYGSMFLLRLPHGPVPFGALVVDRHSIGA
jgi:hypothetical protein